MNNFFVLVNPDDMVVHSRVEGGVVTGVSLLEKGDLPIRKDIFFNDHYSAVTQLNLTIGHVLHTFPKTELADAIVNARVVKYHLTIIEIGTC